MTNEMQARAVIARCEKALLTNDPRQLTVAVLYGAAWAKEMGEPEWAEDIFASLGRILGGWYGDMDEEFRPTTPSVTSLAVLCDVIRGHFHGIARIEAGEIGAEV